MALHKNMKIETKGYTTKMYLARIYPCDGQTVQFGIDYWLGVVRNGIVSRPSNEESSEYTLAYRDNLFRDFRLKLQTKGGTGGDVALVLIWSEIAPKHRRQGYLSKLLAFLEHIAAENSWSFVIEGANEVMTKILISKRYFRFDPRSGIAGLILHRDYRDWNYDPKSKFAEITITCSSKQHERILKNLQTMDDVERREVSRQIEALLARIEGSK